MSSFNLKSFTTFYENNDLLIFWDFDTSSSSLLKAKFQIIIEQELPSKIEIVRHTKFISPYLKQYIIPNLPSNKIYHVCLLITRSSYGSDKYCRETRTSTNTTLSQNLYINRSIIFGFFIGTIITICFLTILAFICHLNYKQKRCRPLFQSQNQNQQKRYMYIDRSENDGTYAYTLVNSPTLRYYNVKKHRHRTYLKPTASWYYHDSRQLPRIRGSPCCFLPYHDRIFTDSITTNRITSLSSDYSSGIDKEPVTSTSIMSNTSLDGQQSDIILNMAKHVYEEVGDNNLFR